MCSGKFTLNARCRHKTNYLIREARSGGNVSSTKIEGPATLILASSYNCSFLRYSQKDPLLTPRRDPVRCCSKGRTVDGSSEEGRGVGCGRRRRITASVAVGGSITGSPSLFDACGCFHANLLRSAYIHVCRPRHGGDGKGKQLFMAKAPSLTCTFLKSHAHSYEADIVYPPPKGNSVEFTMPPQLG